jgi:hypothetical protein
MNLGHYLKLGLDLARRSQGDDRGRFEIFIENMAMLDIQRPQNLADETFARHAFSFGVTVDRRRFGGFDLIRHRRLTWLRF